MGYLEMSLTTHTHTHKWLCGTGISNNKLWNSKCNFFGFSFGFVAVQTSALSPHSYVCLISCMHSCSCAFSCVCFCFFDLFDMCGEGKVSDMFLHMHLNSMAQVVCVCECMYGCVWWLRAEITLAATEFNIMNE